MLYTNHLINIKHIKIKPSKKINNIKYLNNSIHDVYALTQRLFIQAYRRPATLISGIIQPLLWLVLFGALFQNAPVDPLTSNIKYVYFLSPGIIVFTGFTGSINAGLPLMFDREFGFLNRILVSPIKSKNCLLNSLMIFTSISTIMQTSCIIVYSTLMLNSQISFISFLLITIIVLFLLTSIASISILLAFILPGHIELLACLLIINLPTLFSSTALAPLSFMPTWLQIITKINPLTYAIESVRAVYCIRHINGIINLWANINLDNNFIIVTIIGLISLLSIRKIISYKFE